MKEVISSYPSSDHLVPRFRVVQKCVSAGHLDVFNASIRRTRMRYDGAGQGIVRSSSGRGYLRAHGTNIKRRTTSYRR